MTAKEKLRAYHKAWYLANREKIRAAAKIYYHANRAEHKAAQHAWYLANREKVLASYHTTDGARKKRKLRGQPEPTRLMPTHCEICAKAAIKRLQLDHDHATGKFRGWLCGNCNRILGLAYDTVNTLLQAAAYLERNK